MNYTNFCKIIKLNRSVHVQVKNINIFNSKDYEVVLLLRGEELAEIPPNSYTQLSSYTKVIVNIKIKRNNQTNIDNYYYRIFIIIVTENQIIEGGTINATPIPDDPTNTIITINRTLYFTSLDNPISITFMGGINIVGFPVIIVEH